MSLKDHYTNTIIHRLNHSINNNDYNGRVEFNHFAQLWDVYIYDIRKLRPYGSPPLRLKLTTAAMQQLHPSVFRPEVTKFVDFVTKLNTDEDFAIKRIWSSPEDYELIKNPSDKIKRTHGIKQL